MCNIAGYVGTKRAAPILLEMLKREEGFDGGFYTGIATLHEGKIYYAKVVGDVDTLINEKAVQDLPGTIGIIHSRTPSGGGVKWAHPFVTQKNGVVTHAYVANGSSGVFKNRNDEYTRRTEQLLEQGYDMTSRDKGDCMRYQVMKDGSAVHMSDAMCQLIAYHIDAGKGIVEAMSAAFCEMPSEIVGLLLSLAEPNGIAYSRINMPMFVVFSEDGAYLSSTPSAFVGETTEPHALAPCSSGIVYKDGFTVFPYQEPPARVGVIDAEIRSKAYESVCAALKEGEKSFPQIRKHIEATLFKDGDCFPAARLVYEILYWLQKQDKLQIRRDRLAVENVCDGFAAPKFWLSWK